MIRVWQLDQLLGSILRVQEVLIQFCRTLRKWRNEAQRRLKRMKILRLIVRYNVFSNLQITLSHGKSFGCSVHLEELRMATCEQFYDGCSKRYFLSTIKRCKKVTKKAKPVSIKGHEIKIVTIFEWQIVTRKEICSNFGSHLE